MSLYLGNNLIAPNQSNAANKSLSNLDATGQTVINDKADTDLTNITDTGYIKMAKASMPSDTYDTLTVGATGTPYTAPANGWFVSSLVTSSQGPCWGRIASHSNPASTSSFNNVGWEINCILPVSKNETVDYQYNIQATLVSHNLYFIYAVGSESEAS